MFQTIINVIDYVNPACFPGYDEVIAFLIIINLDSRFPLPEGSHDVDDMT